MIYGTQVEPDYYTPLRSLIGEVQTSPSGNVVLRIGREREAKDGSWSQTEHVVLTQSEAIDLIAELEGCLP